MFSEPSPSETFPSEDDKIQYCEEQQLREFRELMATTKGFGGHEMSVLPDNTFDNPVQLHPDKNPVYMVFANKLKFKDEIVAVPLGSRFVTPLPFLSQLFVPELMEPDDAPDKNVAGCTGVKLVKNYEDVQPGDKLFIWNCIDRRGTGKHLSAVIKTATGKYINFGLFPLESERTKIAQPTEDRGFPMFQRLRQSYRSFANENFGTCEAIVRSIDPVFLFKLLVQLQKSSQKHVKLVNVVELTALHVERLKQTFDSIFDAAYNEITYDVVGTMHPSHNCSTKEKQKFVRTMHAVVEKLSTEVDDYSELTDKINEYIASANDPDFSCKAFFFGIITIPFPQMYRRYASAANKTYVNCTSFFDDLFPGVINCGMIGQFVAKDPARCVAGPLKVAQCDPPVSPSEDLSASPSTPPNVPEPKRRRTNSKAWRSVEIDDGDGLFGGKSRRQKMFARYGAKTRRNPFHKKPRTRRRRTAHKPKHTRRFFTERR